MWDERCASDATGVGYASNCFDQPDPRSVVHGSEPETETVFTSDEVTIVCQIR
jgi:hypothetical protein